jgi:cobalt-zinc-cadmium efflux system outer membrane protein
MRDFVFWSRVYSSGITVPVDKSRRADSVLIGSLTVRRLCVLLPLFCVGCRTCLVHPVDPTHALAAIEANVEAVGGTRSAPEVQLCGAVTPPATPPVDLPSFWRVALANNPSLREAAANTEAARGRLIQATKYPNPKFSYDQDSIGTPQAPAGAFRLEVGQTILIAGKRPLDVAVADRALDVNQLALLGRKFTVLTRVRRAYYEYIGLEGSVLVSEDVVALLQRAVEITRKQVEEAKTRPRTDVLRLEALLVNARTTLTTNQCNRDAAWRQLATEVGLPDLAMPSIRPPDLPETIPPLNVVGVTKRVLAVNTELKQAIADSERTRLQMERARAEAVPDVTVAGGYSRSFVENSKGAVISVQTPIPIWDRKQGLIYEAKATYARTVAFQQSTINRLTEETAAAFARYNALRQQVEQLRNEALPRLRDSLDLLLRGYQAGAAQVTFADVFQAQQDLNAARLTLAEARRNLWLAIADLQGLGQIDLDEEEAETRNQKPETTSKNQIPRNKCQGVSEFGS